MPRQTQLANSGTPEIIKPLPRQEADFEASRQILLTNSITFNLSPTGSGKTFDALHKAQEFDLPLIIFTVKSTIPMWDENVRKYGLRYAQIPGQKSSGASTYQSASRSQVDEFWYRYEAAIREGCLIILDEFQNVKNTTATTTQCLCNMIRRLVKIGGPSKAILMSATPIDMMYQCVPMLYMCGIINELHSSDPNGSFRKAPAEEQYDEDIAVGNAQNIKEFLEKTGNEKLYSYISNGYELRSHEYANEFMYNFLRLYIIPKLATRMPAVRKPGVKQDVVNLSMEIHNPYYYETIITIEKKLLDGDSGSDSKTKSSSKNFVQLLEALEKMKIPDAVRFFITRLTTRKNVKLVIPVNFKSTLAMIRLLLFMYKPIHLVGGMVESKRESQIKLFQEQNLNNRIIAFTTGTGSVGVTLDDQLGTFPREMCLFPGSSIIQTVQALGRILRANTLSSSIVWIMYGYHETKQKGESASAEQRIMLRLSDKSSNIENILLHAVSVNDKFAQSIIRTLTSASFMKVLGDGSVVDAPELRGRNITDIKEEFYKEFLKDKSYCDNYFY